MALSRDPLDDLIAELERALPPRSVSLAVPPHLDFVRLQRDLALLDHPDAPWLMDVPEDPEDGA